MGNEIAKSSSSWSENCPLSDMRNLVGSLEGKQAFVKSKFESVYQTGPLSIDECRSHLNALCLPDKFKEHYLGKVSILPTTSNSRPVICVVVTEAGCGKKTTKTPSQLLSPIFQLTGPKSSKGFSQRQKVGLGKFISSLIVGNVFIEWNEQELLIPKIMSSSSSIQFAPLVELPICCKVSEIVDRLALACVEWNTSHKFLEGGRRESKVRTVGNCQDFVDDVLERLQCSVEAYNKDSLLHRFFDMLRERGSVRMEVPLDKDVREYYKLKKAFTAKKKSGKLFKTHKQLDEFALKLAKREGILERGYRDVFVLLRSYDRLFWQRHFKVPNEPIYCPIGHEVDGDSEKKKKKKGQDVHVGCPFGNPCDLLVIMK